MEILFRGKCIDDGKWVEGFFYFFEGAYIRVCHTSCHFDEGPQNVYTDYEVIPETVGQYINYDIGQKLFAGDILKGQNGKLWVIKWLNQAWYVCNHDIIDDGMNKFAGNERYTFYEYTKMRTKSGMALTLIGNIHDLSALIKSLSIH